MSRRTTPVEDQLAEISRADPIARALAASRDAGASISSSSIAFTGGDTVRRVTITDAAVSATSKIICSVIRPDVADADDPGYIYDAVIVNRDAGSFEALVRATDWGGMDCAERPPNETITLCYQVA